MRVEIGEKIRALCRQYGRTQEDLAMALGVTCQAVSRWSQTAVIRTWRWGNLEREFQNESRQHNRQQSRTKDL